MKKQDLKNCGLPTSPGVYFFRDQENHILYIGKATSIADRVKSYFSKDLINTRGLRLVSMLSIAHTVTFEKTDSVLEALLLESKYIKKHKPIFNTKEKDDKSFACVVVTKENFPRVLLMRIRDYEKTFSKKDVDTVFGPFKSMNEAKEMLNIIRKIFPFRDKCQGARSDEDVRSQQTKDAKQFGKPCFNAQIGLCPGVCSGKISQKEYKKNILNIKKFFQGKKENIISSLSKEMKKEAKGQNFEKAILIRNTLYSLAHIKDINLIKQEDILSFKKKGFRIEAYDVAHISGTNRVGVMVVLSDGEKNKKEYRKFKLKENTNNDYEGIVEMIKRRFTHNEWTLPDLVVFDGGIGQKNIGDRTLIELNLLIPSVSVVKNERHKPKDIIGDKIIVDNNKKEILLANNEAHRFAINYHKHLRNKIN